MTTVRRFHLAMGGPAAAALLVLLAGPPAAARAQGAARPNIVLILADDLGFSDVGGYGGEVPTTNLDRLAAVGIGHLNGPGTYPGDLDRATPTVASLLREAGYATYMVGKWQVTPWPGPLVLFLSDNGGCAEEIGPEGRAQHFPRRTRDGRPIRLGNGTDILPGPRTPTRATASNGRPRDGSDRAQGSGRVPTGSRARARVALSRLGRPERRQALDRTPDPDRRPALTGGLYLRTVESR